ncbi:RecQ family ATP-dependent DNA helicase [Xylophilus sp. GOD-11R]|uniref:RecQ family ATP-dependent DNA helicase n=1 Tax=Xylophilus sp. GOD-11R TaxID=3089814 RepID=UPI00298C2057|nr:RecQ family ATP-dependent DNA helicase [Xylophilus sp. GOD-11R]WPB58109.1 RecQ family ATP-dependent DNA helicase [Xylophilus sp. GOD-11R]
MPRSPHNAKPLPDLVRTTLRKTFRLKTLRPGQQETIERVLASRSTLAVMPTGAGKSLCYQLPAVLLPGITLVVSPLIALMQDQCSALNALGVQAVQLNSAIDTEELQQAEAAIARRTARIVLTTPERLADPKFQDLLAEGAPVSLLVVDEAHCISQWGHDFRPAFLEIAAARKALGQPPVLALTATATEAVAADIRAQLGIPVSGMVETGTYRPNLDYAVDLLTNSAEKLARTVALVRDSSGAGLVYAATVKAAEAVRDALLAADVPDVGLYHGKLGPTERHDVQQAFMAGEIRVVVATNAFGLGIDKQDIRFVIHHQMPGSLDAYYQETGRAGRDGQRCDCTLLFLRKDRAVQQFFLTGRYPDLADLDALWAALQAPAPDDGWSLQALADATDRPVGKLKVCVSLLRQRRIVSVDPRGVVRLRRADVESAVLEAAMQTYQDKRTADRASLERMVDYAQSGRCRWQVLLESVGHDREIDRPPCGHCDTCRRIAQAQQETNALPLAA